MPKTNSSISEKLRVFVREFGDKHFSTDGNILFCKLCEVEVEAKKRFNVQQHCSTAKYKSNLFRNVASENRQQLLFEKISSSSNTSKMSDFNKDLCKMMMSTNILLEKINNQHFIDFLQKYTNQHVPNATTLRKNYVTTCYEEILNRIRSCVADNKIWVSMDETTDAEWRYVANVVVGVLRGDRPGEKFLISSEALERTNHSTIAVTFDNALNPLWPEGVKRENVLLLVTDAAPYMVKAGKGLQLLYPKMIHLTCIAHALHRVAEEIRGNYPDVDKLIATVKSIHQSSNTCAEIQGNCSFCAFASSTHPYTLGNVA